MKIELHHKKEINLDQVSAVSQGKASVTLSKETRRELDKRRKQLETFIEEQGFPAYGFNRGFGHNVDLQVSNDHLSKLQENLIVSHAVGLGDMVRPEIVRMMILLRAQSLCHGFSGIRSLLVDQLLKLLKHDILPLIPELGSVGASGDLAPLSHLALGVMGKGRVLYRDKIMNARTAFKKAGIEPLQLAMKEGLALNNGIQFMTAIGLYCCLQMQTYLKTACIQTAMTAQVMLSTETPFRKDLHELRPHPGAKKTAAWIFNLMQGSPLREAHREYHIDGEIQDPYNIRCAAQILGSCSELIDECLNTLLREVNSVTDNPLVLPVSEDNREESYKNYRNQFVDIVSGGHFHGMPVATKIYNLIQAMGIMAGLTNQRCARFVDDNRNKGLGRDLKWPELSDELKAISSAMMMPEYSSAALANAIWGEAMPSHLFNISTNTGQEDHVSMGAGLAVRIMKALPKLSYILAIEMAYISQAAAIRKLLEYIPSKVPVSKGIRQRFKKIEKNLGEITNPFSLDIQLKEKYAVDPSLRKLNPMGESILSEVSDIFPVVKKDRVMSDELQNLAELISSGKVVELACNYVDFDEEL
ncbi:MAG: aromatic amino acid ammonia-lyase [Proteobacteria bacterium]|nr:aromatic amino acid ammonia-lyase [Pseudomonadota bacterium]